MCSQMEKTHTHTQTMLTRRLLESGKISPKVQAREREKQRNRSCFGAEMSTRQSTKGDGREKQYKLDAADATASRQLVARNKRHRVACAAAPSFTSAPATAPCAFSLVVAQELTLSRISQRN